MWGRLLVEACAPGWCASSTKPAMSPAPTTRVLNLCACLVLAGTLLCGQQPNSPAAGLVVNGQDPGTYPVTALLPSPGTSQAVISGAPGSAFSLHAGNLSPGFLDLGGAGLVDLDLWAGVTTIMDGFDPVSPYREIAVTGAAGTRAFSVFLPSGHLGSLGTVQGLVADPGNAAGVRLTAAAELFGIPGFTLGDISPDNGTYFGGEPVTITGTGFSPYAWIQVSFGPYPALSASVTSSTTIVAVTPPGPPGSTLPVTVTIGGVSVTLEPGFTYHQLPGPELLINEIFTGGVDFVELYNPSPYTVDLGGWELWSWYHGTTPDAGAPFVFPAGTLIQPGGFLVVQEMGLPGQPGTLPLSISTGHNFWWTAGRQVEVALLDASGAGVDYVHRRWTGVQQAPNLPWNLAWTGSITDAEDAVYRTAYADTDDAADFSLASSGSPGVPNPGQ